MKRADWIFITVAAVVIVFFAALSAFSTRPPTLPNDPDHRATMSRAQCLSCHNPQDPAAKNPMTPKHPTSWKDERFKCMNCHRQVQ
jgi:hypothetical protein